MLLAFKDILGQEHWIDLAYVCWIGLQKGETINHNGYTLGIEFRQPTAEGKSNAERFFSVSSPQATKIREQLAKASNPLMLVTYPEPTYTGIDPANGPDRSASVRLGNNAEE